MPGPEKGAGVGGAGLYLFMLSLLTPPNIRRDSNREQNVSANIKKADSRRMPEPAFPQSKHDVLVAGVERKTMPCSVILDAD